MKGRFNELIVCLSKNPYPNTPKSEKESALPVVYTTVPIDVLG
jgi:hypothetical protein